MLNKIVLNFLYDNFIEYARVIPFSACNIINKHLLDIQSAQSVLMILIPYYSGIYENNVSLYAIPKDYHIYFKKLFCKLIPLLESQYPEYHFKGFADHSPISEVHAAAVAKLGIIGDNNMLINEKYASFVFIGEIISDMPCDTFLPDEVEKCEHCNKCIRSCPSVQYGVECLSKITQSKQNLSPLEEHLIQKYKTVWGCDICQLVCPHTKNIEVKTPISFFNQELIYNINLDLLSHMNDEEFSQRAYAWRKRKCISRNTNILLGSNINMITNFFAIIKEAGKIILSAQNIDNTTSIKSGTSNFVTSYDVAVQKFLCEKLSAIIPDAHFLAEESESNYNEKISEGYCFIIDPIDGTTNFIHNYRHSAISVGLLYQNEIILGIVYNPYTNEMFYAEKGKGAFLNDKKITVSERPLNDGLVCFGTTPYYREYADSTFNLIKKLYLNCRDIRRSGSAALDLCYIACGRCDLFFEMILSPWDYAAGSIIIQEAGGIISTMEKSIISFEKSISILAANKYSYSDFFK